MLGLNKKEDLEFGILNAADDKDIEVHHIKIENRRGIVSESFLLFRDILFVFAIMLLFGVFVAQPVVVEGTSMLPQLHNGERLIVNKLIYYHFPWLEQRGLWTNLSRGDVVVFWYPKNPSASYVKRVIGLPDETVELRNGVVFINNQKLDEPYLDTTLNLGQANLSPTLVEKHHYFVMGDNRDNSSDSRIWGQVPEKYIYGKAFFRYWQPSMIGTIPRGEFHLEENSRPVLNRPVQTEPEENENN